jgi:hypothetical protein
LVREGVGEGEAEEEGEEEAIEPGHGGEEKLDQREKCSGQVDGRAKYLEDTELRL